jgi:predicted ATPase
LIGRKGELQVLADGLPARRLVTITGSPGMGKTRLALAAAQAQAHAGDASTAWDR